MSDHSYIFLYWDETPQPFAYFNEHPSSADSWDDEEEQDIE
jgi:hypothetical protein